MIPSPLPDYKFPGFKNEKLATSLSGVLGAVILFGLGCGIACLLRKRKSDHETRIH
jgi:cobalt/nickel transport protein